MQIITLIASVCTFVLLVLDIRDRRRERAEAKAKKEEISK